MQRIRLVLGLSLSFAVAACGGSSSSSTSVAISAAQGGAVAMPDNSASITIPPGALTADTTITIKRLSKSGLPDEANLASAAFEFGPTGTTFATPATLQLAFSGQVTDDKQAVLAVLDGGAWKTIDGSALAAGVVSASISHFSTYIVLLQSKAIVPTGPCAEAFTACGGTLVGAWTANDYCMNTNVPLGGGESPFDDLPECADSEMGLVLSAAGTLNFEENGTFASSLTPVSTLTATFHDACLQALVAQDTSGKTYTNEEACAGLSSLMTSTFQQGCVYSTNSCKCTSNPTTGTTTERSGTYAVEGSSFTYTVGSATSPAMGFCVDGAELKLETQRSASDETIDILVFTKN